MSDARTGDGDLIIRAAWLYYIHGLGQEEVARRLGLSRTKVTRLLSQARDQGLVKISIEHEMVETLALADWMAATYQVRECILTPPMREPDADAGSAAALRQARQAVGIVAANHLGRRLQAAGPISVALGCGRTIAEVVTAFSAMVKGDADIVSAVGASTHDDGTGSYALTMRLAAAIGGRPHPLIVPLVASTPAAAAMLREEPTIARTLERARRADLHVLGFSDCRTDDSFFRAAGLAPEDVEEVRASGAVCEIGGCFLTAEGLEAPTNLNHRTLGLGFDALRRCRVVVVAAGRDKTDALRAVLAAGIADAIIIDHKIAEDLASRR